MSRNACLLLGLSTLLAALSVLASRPSWLPFLRTNATSDSLSAPPAIDGPPLDHATPGTPPPIRVLLGSKARGKHRIRIDGPYRVRVLGDWRVLAQGERLATCDVIVSSDTLQVGNNAFEHSSLQIDVLQSGTLWVNDHRYHGSLQLIGTSEGQLRAIGLVDTESYVASVVNGEMPGDFPVAARQAQAIAARTYAIYHIKSGGRDPEFDLYDNTRSQMYRGIEYLDRNDRRLAAETPASRKIARDTAGMVLLYNGRIINSYYSAVCGGHTANGTGIFSDAAPPLIGVPCDSCAAAPRYRWSIEMPQTDLFERLSAYLDRIGRHVGEIATVEATDAQDGRLPQVNIRGTKTSHRITTATLRRHVLQTSDLPSAFCSINQHDSLIHFSGRGWGHGVGLCQWGARGKAQAGDSCVEILLHYYPGCQVRVVE